MTVSRGRRPGAPDTRAEVLDAARVLFAERGFSRTTIRAVAADAGVDVEDLEDGEFSRFSLAHNVAEEEDVDSALAEAAQAGAAIVKEAQEVFFGRHGFFADPDGFLWEVAWNPSFPMAADGSLELPE